jgi:peroxiredoxin Q/BCP
MLKHGDIAPDFSVRTDKGDVLTLSALRGKKVLLWFYPKADTPG